MDASLQALRGSAQALSAKIDALQVELNWNSRFAVTGLITVFVALIGPPGSVWYR